MKEFDKWWMLNQHTIKHNNATRRLAGEAAWKAALEWVREEFAYALDGDKYWIVQEIDKELEN